MGELGKAALASQKRRAEKALRESVTGSVTQYDKEGKAESTRYFYKGKEMYSPESKGKNLATANITLATGETIQGKVQVSGSEASAARAANAARQRVLAGRQQRGEVSTFTGKVEESYQGQPTSTRYYVQGQETAQVVRQGAIFNC